MRITIILPSGERCDLRTVADQILADAAAGSSNAAELVRLGSHEVDDLAVLTHEQREATALLRAIFDQPSAARELLQAAEVRVQERARLLLAHAFYRHCPGADVDMEPETDAERIFMASVHTGSAARH